MTLRIDNGRICIPAQKLDRTGSVFIRDGLVVSFHGDGPLPAADQVLDATGHIVCPGFVDMHVHLREPGQTHKETIQTGTLAALAGGVTAVCAMPNTDPVCDTPERVLWVRKRAQETGHVRVLPVAAITRDLEGRTLTDFAALRAAGACALSDDGKPVLSDALMRETLIKADVLGLPVLSHCEPETEMAQRDILLAEETGTRVHICHVSRKETVDAIRAAKARGVQVTAETCPHYFTFTQDAVTIHGSNAKMNPPLGRAEDRQAVLDGLCDGTLDAIATDHAPHSPAEKDAPFDDAPNGIIGLETLLAASYTALVQTGLLSLSDWIAKHTCNPARILRQPLGDLCAGQPADLVVFHPEESVVAERFHSLSRNSPFTGMRLLGRVTYVLQGQHFWENSQS